MNPPIPMHLARTLVSEKATKEHAGVSCSRMSAAHLVLPTSSSPSDASSKYEACA